MSAADRKTTTVAECGRAIVLREVAALGTLLDDFDETRFAAAVAMLVACTGTVVTVGAGTSGIVARKVAATLTSTGTPAWFMHPGDALHGDLGTIRAGDVVVAISNGGETAELLALLPHLAGRGVPVIAIVGNARSTLGRRASLTLTATAVEADAHGLVPSSSVLAALVIADALALTVMDARGVTPESFATNHPSGRLGRRLTLRVRDVMHAGDALAAVSRDAPLLDVVSAISAGGLGAVVVTGGGAVLEGLVTDGDVRRAIAACGPDFRRLSQLRAADIATARPVSIAPDAMALDALRRMEDRPSQISVLPVTEGDRCLGLLRLHDLVRIGL